MARPKGAMVGFRLGQVGQKTLGQLPYAIINFKGINPLFAEEEG
jgi:hypothetical protein